MRIPFPSQHFRAHPYASQRGVQEREAKKAGDQGNQHRRRHRRSALAQDRRTLMQRIPPRDREVDDRHVDDAYNGEHRAGAIGFAKIVIGRAQSHVPEVQEQQNQLRGETRIPGPPCAPHRSAPDGSGRQTQEGKRGTDRRGRRRQRMGKFDPPDQAHRGGHSHDRVTHERQPSGRGVYVDDAKRITLLVIRGCKDEPRIESVRHQQGRRNREPRDHLARDSIEMRR